MLGMAQKNLNIAQIQINKPKEEKSIDVVGEKITEAISGFGLAFNMIDLPVSIPKDFVGDSPTKKRDLNAIVAEF